MGATAIHLICDAVDAIATCDGRALPVGALAALYRGVDATRRDGFSDWHVHAAEDMIAHVFRLTTLQSLADAKTQARADRIKRELSDACSRWILDLPIGCA